MKILQLTPRLPYPPIDGGRVVMLQVAQALHRLGAEVQVLSLNPLKQHADFEAARRALAPITLTTVDFDTQAVLPAVLSSWRTGTPLLVARFYSRAYAAALRRMLASAEFDLVQVESPFLLPYLPLIRQSTNAVVVLRSLNVEFRIWEQLAAHEPQRLRRVWLRAIARSLRRYECAQLNSCDAVVPITEDDAAELRALGCTRPMHVLPGAVDIPAAREPAIVEREGSAGFLGSLDYRPNQEAALWIAETLRPRLLAAGFSGSLHVAGSNAPQWLRERLGEAGVTLELDVPDSGAFLASMECVLAPLLAGGGMRIKILEAMALGRPVVATSLAAAGVEVRDGENVLLADDPDSFAAAVLQLSGDASRRRAIGEAGRRLVAERYGSNVLTPGLLAFYEELLDRSRIRGRHGA